jgi:glucose/arabinose dehydrogenase
LSFVEIARLDGPMAVRTRTGSTSLYVAERAGRLVELTGDDVAPRESPVLDISEEVSTNGERGFLGFDFSTDGTLVWTMHNDPAGTSVVTEWALGDDDLVDLSTRRELLRIDQPFSNHNGGDLHLGPDGYLYIGLGDGGGSGDPSRNGQNPTTFLGTLLRIDPTPDDDRAYSIPPDNPFVAGGGAPQVWSHGLRNPWRFSFDSATGDLWIGDVGHSLYEEIDLLPAADGGGRGANLGWSDFEGDQPFAAEVAPVDHVAPVVVYDHSAGRCSVTGGFVYRGTAIPALDGVYVFGDLCDRTVRGFVPGIGVAPLNLPTLGASLISFGLDTDGELLTVGSDGRIHRIVAD